MLVTPNKLMRMRNMCRNNMKQSILEVGQFMSIPTGVSPPNRMFKADSNASTSKVDPDAPASCAPTRLRREHERSVPLCGLTPHTHHLPRYVVQTPNCLEWWVHQIVNHTFGAHRSGVHCNLSECSSLGGWSIFACECALGTLHIWHNIT